MFMTDELVQLSNSQEKARPNGSMGKSIADPEGSAVSRRTIERLRELVH